MSRSRKPAAFTLDDPDIIVMPAPEVAPATVGAEETEPSERAVVAMLRQRQPHRAPSRIPWATLFWAAAAGLILLATGLGIADLIEELLDRARWLGGLGILFAALACIALTAIVVREVEGLMRLGAIDNLRERAAAILLTDDRAKARELGHDLLVLTRPMPSLARARARLESHFGEIIDGADLVRLSERELMASLDEEARRLVTAAARRVSVVTAVSPRAALDMLFVLLTALGLVRRLALLYGGRPGTLSLLKLMRQAVTHLAFTGGMAATDSLIQQVIGHGVAAKLSTRLGEGMLNGLLTARLGLAAIEATRPMPFVALRRPTLNDLAGTLLRGAEKAPEALRDPARP